MNRPISNPKSRALAQRLLAYEVAAANAHSGAEGRPGSRVIEKLRQLLTRLAGAAGFRVLLARALTLVETRFPDLKKRQIQSDDLLPVWEEGSNHDAAELKNRRS